MKTIELTREQELRLIRIGLDTLLNGVEKPVEAPKPKKKRWSATQHRKFKATMAKMWAERRKKVV